MSHELRTPLNAIIGFSDMMKNRIFGPLGSAQYDQYARDISSSGTHLLALIQDILDTAMIEREELEKNETDFCLMPFLREAIRVVDVSALEERGRIMIDDGDEALTLFADRRMCMQMVSNLCRNALKFSPRDSVVQVSVDRRAGEDLVISVTDQGGGIPESDRNRVTEPFVRLASPAVRGGQSGVGLGLYITRQFIEAHSGRLKLESELGKGTSARLVFPAWRVDRGNACCGTI
jgi:signal transduction histidine kinase